MVHQAWLIITTEKKEEKGVEALGIEKLEPLTDYELHHSLRSADCFELKSLKPGSHQRHKGEVTQMQNIKLC